MAMLEDTYNDGDVQGVSMAFPGFRFYPTEEELLDFYLKKRVQCGDPLEFHMIIPTLDLYQYDPSQLPRLAHVGDRQSFFFVPRVHGKSCGRPNRLTVSGFWKSTGSDRAVRNELLHCIGIKKTLVFYKGKGLGAQKTNWIMNEYRLPDFSSSTNKVLYQGGEHLASLSCTKLVRNVSQHVQKNMDMVLCRIYRKAASRKSMEQPAMPYHVDKEGTACSTRDKFEENLSNSFPVRGGCSSLHSPNQEAVCSSDLSKANDEDSLFECLEPVMLFCEESKTCKQQHIELPTLPPDYLFNHEAIPIPWADNISAWAPYDLLSTP